MRVIINTYKNIAQKQGTMRPLGKSWRRWKKNTALKWKFQKYEVKEWTGFNWLRTGSKDTMINHRTPQKQQISSFSKQENAFQEYQLSRKTAHGSIFDSMTAERRILHEELHNS
jgi:hypothetical protein